MALTVSENVERPSKLSGLEINWEPKQQWKTKHQNINIIFQYRHWETKVRNAEAKHQHVPMKVNYILSLPSPVSSKPDEWSSKHTKLQS